MRGSEVAESEQGSKIKEIETKKRDETRKDEGDGSPQWG